MIEFKLANTNDFETLALLGRVTFNESHGAYIEDKTNLTAYLNSAFSIAKTIEELKNPDAIYYIIYNDKFPVGYAKLVLNATIEFVPSEKSCRLERIYILDQFIAMKFGHQLLDFILKKAKELNFKNVWLSVYIKNTRAIHFYEKNDFKNVGSITFKIGEQGYENPILSKKI